MNGAIAILLFLFTAGLSTAQPAFYLSAEGDDAADGLSPATAWKTLQKANLEMHRLQPGSRLLLRRGDTFFGGLAIPVSGTEEEPVTIGAFGEGEPPVLTGAISVPPASWKEWRDGIYAAPVSEEVHWLFAADKFLTPARYPNSGFLRFPESSEGKFSNQFKDASGRPDGYWVESTVHLRGHRFVYQEKPVMAHHDSTVILWGNVYSPIKGFGYFFDHHFMELDSVSEWHYQLQSGMVFYKPEKPEDLNNCQAVIQKTGILLQGDHLHIEGLFFEYYSQYGIKGDYRRDITIQNCSFRHINDRAVDVSRGQRWEIAGNRFRDILNTAIRTGDCREFKVKENDIRRVALQQGLFRFPFGSAIYVGGRESKNNYFGYNVIDSVGRQGFYVNGEGHLIEKNRIANTIMFSDDDGAINLYGGGGVIARDIVIRDNYIENTFGELESVDTWYTWQKGTMDVGIYTDDLSQNILIEGNTIINTNTGVLMHNNQGVVLRNNTIFKPREMGVDVRNDWIINDWEFMKDNRLEGNIIYVDAADAHPLQVFDEKNNWRRFATYEGNTLINPAGKEVILREWVDNDYSTYKGQDREFAAEEWKAILAGGGNAAPSRGAAALPWEGRNFRALIISNPSDVPLTKSLTAENGRAYYDLDGKVIEAVSLAPWQSAIVLLAGPD